MEQQTALSQISRTSSAFVACICSKTVFFFFYILLANAHAQSFSWQSPYMDAFNAAVTATVHTEPPHATCGYPGVGNTFHPLMGRRGRCSNTCDPSQTYRNKTSRLRVYTSPFVDTFRETSFWQKNCSPELDSVHRRKRKHVNDGRGKRRADAEMCFRYDEADVGPGFPRETHVMKIHHAHDIFEGVVLDVQKQLGSRRLSLSLRVTGSDLKLTYDNRVRVYHNPEPPHTLTHIAIQHDTSMGVDGQSLFVNGLYLTRSEVLNEPQSDAARRRRPPEVEEIVEGSQRLSFGVVGDPVIRRKTDMLDFLAIQECKDIHYSAMVTVAHPDNGLVSTQRSIAKNIFSRGRKTSVYNCPHDVARLTHFACAFYMPALHTSPDGNVMKYLPCKRMCEEIKAACGATLDAVPLLGNLSCEVYPKERCVDTDYIPYMGIYNGKIEDYKYYNDILTNREIHALVTGGIAPVPPFTPLDFSECLCPPDHPAIYAGNPHLCVTNRVNDNRTDLRRGDAQASIRYKGETLHVPEMATDLDPDTAWVSGSDIEQVALVLLFPDIYQVLGVTFGLNSTFPGIPSVTDEKSVEIALLSGDGIWRTVYYMDRSCDYVHIPPAGRIFQPSEVVCISPIKAQCPLALGLCTDKNRFTVDFLQGKTDHMTPKTVHPGLLSMLNGRGLRLKFNALPIEIPEERAQRSHIVSQLQVHARGQELRSPCGSYAKETDPRAECSHSGQCPWVYSQHTLCGCYKVGTHEGTDVHGNCSHSGQCPCRSDNGDPHHGGLKCEPYVLNLLPTYGPVSGGTRITIMGGYFGEYSPGPDKWHDASHAIYIVFGNSGLTCSSVRYTQTTIECKTTPVNDTSEWVNTPLKLTVQFSSGFQLMGDSLVFTYKPDPVIDTIQPLTSFLSGGVNQTVVGRNFDSVAEPFMTLAVIVNGQLAYSQPSPELCTVINNTLMHCPSPTVDSRLINPLLRKRRDVDMLPVYDNVTVEMVPVSDNVTMETVDVYYNVTTETDPIYDNVTTERAPIYHYVTMHDNVTVLTVTEDERSKTNEASINSEGMHDFEIGFKLDGLPTYRNVTAILGPEQGQLLMHYDPDFEIWKPETLIYRPYDNDKFIKIRGFRLDYGAQLSDYRVTISREQCEVVQLDMKTLTCRPPSHRPQPDLYFRDGAHRVLVEVGKLTHHVGYLKYYMSLWDDPVFSTAIIGSAVLVGVVALILIAYLVVRRVYGDPIALIRARRNKYKTTGQNYRPRKLMDMLDPGLKAQIKECLIKPHTRMTLGHEVGKGNFGKVYSGQLVMPRPQLPRACAIKTLKEDSNDEKELREFLEEATIMKDFSHPNVLTLYGVVITQNKPHVLLPFMAHGDLKAYLSSPRNTFSIGELLDFGLQVAKGMEYLSSNKFVHRDLAARNCMVDDKKVVKIADFGLARDIYERDYYAVEDRRRPMPIKWMAPECLETFKFDSRSDVWSYGVTLWESLTRGRKPYPGIDNLDMKRFLMRGGRLEKPTFCPAVIYALMKDCWNLDPHSRPMFPLIATRIRDSLDAARQMETPNKEATSHDYLEMVHQPGYVPLETAVPSDEAPWNDTEPQSMAYSQRYTSEPHKEKEPQLHSPRYQNDADAATPSQDALDLSSQEDYLVPTGSGVKSGQSPSTHKHLAPIQVSVEVHGEVMDTQL